MTRIVPGIPQPLPTVPPPLMLFPFFTRTLLGWLVLLALMVLVLWWVWNLTVPELFGLPRLRFWQAFRLVVITAILFGGVHIGIP